MLSEDSNALEALRLQLAAVKQHFIHVLILEARGDNENAASINEIDSIDLPNAMQVVEHLVMASRPFGLCENKGDLVQSMPEPGFKNSEIIASERRLEGSLLSALERYLHQEHSSPDDAIRGLMAQSYEPRSAYSAKLSDWEREPESSYVARSPLTDAQSRWIDCLFAKMMVVIDQTMVHAFVHRHNGDTQKAGIAWEVSGAAMMQATALTKGLAARGLAANPSSAVKTDGAVALPHISIDVAQAVVADRDLAAHCVEICCDCEQVLDQTEFHPLIAKAKSYFEAVRDWKDGDNLPRIPNPCRDFERTLEVYVRQDDLGRTA